MASTVVAGIAARAAKSRGLAELAADADFKEPVRSSAWTRPAADTCQMNGIEVSQASPILKVAALTGAATFARQPPIHAASGATARGRAKTAPRTCQRLTA